MQTAHATIRINFWTLNPLITLEIKFFDTVHSQR